MILVNGKQTQCVPVDDRGLMYGDGLFETIEITHGRPVLLAQHLKRLKSGCEQLGLTMPASDVLIPELENVSGQHDKGILKITLTRGSGGRGYRPPEETAPLRIISFHAWPEIPAEHYRHGIKLYPCQTDVSVSKALSGLKTLCRLDQVMAQREWDEADFAEGLMCDATGHVIEGTRTNLFVIVNGELFTPSLQTSGIKGIMRDMIIELALRYTLPVHEKTMDVNFVKQADEVFVCNSIIHIWPVCQYAKTNYKVGKITRKLMRALQQELGND